MEIVKVTENVTALVTPVPVPGIGVLPVNSFVIKTAGGAVLVDSCITQPTGEFLSGVGGIVDPADIKWIWLTHPDRDHTGGIFSLLEAAPNARLITTFGGAGILSTEFVVPMDRVFLLNPGQDLDLGDRTITAFRPPLFDNAVTVGLFDSSSGTMFSSDCFGAPLETAEAAMADSIDAINPAELTNRQLLWTSVDSPWVHVVDQAKFDATLEPIRAFDPSTMLSTHLPPAIGRTSDLLATASRSPGLDPFVGPDQAALEAILAQFEPVAP